MINIGTLHIIAKGQTEAVFIHELVNTDLVRIDEETNHLRKIDPVLMCGLDSVVGTFSEIGKGADLIDVDISTEHTQQLTIKFTDAEQSTKCYSVKVMLVFEEDTIPTYIEKAREQDAQVKAINIITKG